MGFLLIITCTRVILASLSANVVNGTFQIFQGTTAQKTRPDLFNFNPAIDYGISNKFIFCLSFVYLLKNVYLLQLTNIFCVHSHTFQLPWDRYYSHFVL